MIYDLNYRDADQLTIGNDTYAVYRKYEAVFKLFQSELFTARQKNTADLKAGDFDFSHMLRMSFQQVMPEDSH